MALRRSLLTEALDALDSGDFVRARSLALAEEQAIGKRGDEAARSETRRVLALAAILERKLDDAEPAAHDAIRLAKVTGSPQRVALAELALAQVLRARGDYEKSLEIATKAYHNAARGDDVRIQCSVLLEYALVLLRCGDDERAREIFDELLSLPLAKLPRAQALRAIAHAAMAHRGGGRFEVALRTLDRAADLPKGSASDAAEWSIVTGRLLTLVDLGAYEEARALLDELGGEGEEEPGWKRAQVLGFRAGIGLSTGELRGEAVEALIEEAVATPGLDPAVRFGLERIRALALLQRGRLVEAERVAVGLTAGAAKTGTRAFAAQGLAIAARAGAQDAWLLRWLGVVACATGGASARVEHEAYAALVIEPEPIGQLARNALAAQRARLVDRAPPAYRRALHRMLVKIEQRTIALRQSKRTEAEVAVTDDVVRAKDEVGIAGESAAIMRPVATIARAARTNASLVLNGETGSGKELFARLAHRLSTREKAPFVAVNCAAIPATLLEAELFGHERGAFTGAERSRPGLFVEAERGTLFLDEVGEMSPAMQAKLLRVLEDGEVRPVGGTRSRKVDVRVIAATHRDLAAMVAAGTFREDLYYRLAAITVRVPSLRERPEDLPAIARALLAREPSTKDHRLDVPGIAVLAEHPWPGNVRELANVLRVAAAMVEGHVIGRNEIAAAVASSIPLRARADGAPALKETTLAALRARHRAELRELIGRALASADGNKLAAAKSLGISRQGLYRVLDA